MDHPEAHPSGPGLTDDQYLELLRRDADALAGAAAVDLAATVPSCAGWRVADLLDHTSDIHRWASGQCEAAPDRVRKRDLPTRAADTSPLTWFDESVAHSRTVLSTIDLDTPTQTWAGEQTGRWWLRRLANETAVHRWDAQSATGTPAPVDPALAADGIDEILAWFAPIILDRSTLDRTVTLHLHATDEVPGHAGEWFVEAGPDDLRWDHRHAKGDVAVRGPVSALLLSLWSRSDDGVEVLGDEQVFDRVGRSMTA